MAPGLFRTISICTVILAALRAFRDFAREKVREQQRVEERAEQVLGGRGKSKQKDA